MSEKYLGLESTGRKVSRTRRGSGTHEQVAEASNTVRSPEVSECTSIAQHATLYSIIFIILYFLFSTLHVPH